MEGQPVEFGMDPVQDGVFNIDTYKDSSGGDTTQFMDVANIFFSCLSIDEQQQLGSSLLLASVELKQLSPQSSEDLVRRKMTDINQTIRGMDLHQLVRKYYAPVVRKLPEWVRNGEPLHVKGGDPLTNEELVEMVLVQKVLAPIHGTILKTIRKNNDDKIATSVMRFTDGILMEVFEGDPEDNLCAFVRDSVDDIVIPMSILHTSLLTRIMRSLVLVDLTRSNGSLVTYISITSRKHINTVSAESRAESVSTRTFKETRTQLVECDPDGSTKQNGRDIEKAPGAFLKVSTFNSEMKFWVHNYNETSYARNKTFSKRVLPAKVITCCLSEFKEFGYPIEDYPSVFLYELYSRGLVNALTHYDLEESIGYVDKQYPEDGYGYYELMASTYGYIKFIPEVLDDVIASRILAALIELDHRAKKLGDIHAWDNSHESYSVLLGSYLRLHVGNPKTLVTESRRHMNYILDVMSTKQYTSMLRKAQNYTNVNP